MILHLVTDEKFTDYAIQQFSAPEMQSEFVLIPSNFSKGESDVALIDRCRVIKQGSNEFTNLLRELGSYQAIILHGLFWEWMEQVLKSVPDHVKVAWVFWGGEIYGRKDIGMSSIAPISKFAYRLHSFKNKNRKTEPRNLEIPTAIFQRIDYCLTGEAEEYKFACDYLNHKTMKHIWYTYYSMEDTVGSLISSQSQEDGILFCNSASIHNNMFDAILYLAKPSNRKHLEGRKIIMPLSYGSPWIRNSMIKIGKFLFKSNFHPLIDYMPREEYNKLMTQCSTLILPYWIPAGQGNILTALWLGMRVYLSERSIAFNFFKRIDAKIFSLEKDFPVYHYTRLSEEEVEHNRAVMRKWYSKEHVQQSAKDVVRILTSTPPI